MLPLARALALPRRFRESCRNFGLRFTLYYLVVYRLLPSWLLQFGTLVVLTRSLEGFAPEVAEDPEVRIATPDDLALLLPTLPPGDQAYWVQMLDAGERVWVLLRDARLVAISTTIPLTSRSPGWLLHQGRPDDVWGGQMWVAPEARGGGIAGRVRLQMLAHFRRLGAKRRLSLVVASNRSSLRSQAKTGAQPLGRVRYARFLGFAVVRAGRLWRCGWCSAARPLVVPVAAYDASD